MMKRQNMIIVLLFCSLSYLNAADAQTDNNYIILDGMHTFASGDDPAWRSLPFDDSKWRSIIVPGSWQSQGIKSSKGLGWYRIHFTAPESFRKISPALLLGRVGDADEVFLNGVKIGGQGLIAETFVEATKVERLYPIPSGLLRYNQDNLIAVRVMNTYLNGGIFDKNVTIGDYYPLLIEKYKRDKYVILAEFCFFTFFAIFFMTCFFFFLKGLRDKEYIYFWLFISLYGVLFSLNSLNFFNAEYKTPFVQLVINTIAILLPANLFLLLMNVYQEKMNTFVKSILASYIFIFFIMTLFPFFTVKQNFYIIWKISFILTAAFLFFYAIKAYGRKLYESGPILLGITGLMIGFVLESVAGLDLLQITGFFLWDYSAGFFMICVMYALTSRYTRIKDIQSASIRIFNAHEDERKRLARELHDGIGTSLLAIKLKLQMLDAKAKEGTIVGNEAFPELISEIGHSINELRDVAMDLRPSFLENVELADAIDWHAKRVQERLGVSIKISIENMIKLSVKTKETLYRIYQEAISNAIKHSGATMIEVVLRRDGNFLHLEVKDNGKGFEPHGKGKKTPGIGLDTIKERVELLGGFLNIKSSEKKGTSIYIEVPVE